MNIVLGTFAGAILSIIYTGVDWIHLHKKPAKMLASRWWQLLLIVRWLVGTALITIFLLLFGNDELPPTLGLCVFLGFFLVVYTGMAFGFDEGVPNFDRDSQAWFWIGVSIVFYGLIIGLAFATAWDTKYIFLTFAIIRPILSFVVYRILTQPAKKRR